MRFGGGKSPFLGPGLENTDKIVYYIKTPAGSSAGYPTIAVII